MNTKLVILVALVCFTAQASFLETLLANTKLRGKTFFNTTKGLKVGYEGGVAYNLAGKDIDLLSVGMNFNAVPEVHGSATNVNTSVKYTGGISITDGASALTSNVTVSGLAKVLTNVNVTYNNASKTTVVLTNNTFSDANTFVIRSGLSVISGKGSESLSTSGTVVQKGSNVKVHQDSTLSLAARGVAVSNGTSLGAYTALSTTTSSTNQNVKIHTSSWLPDATYSGSTDFNNTNSLAFQNTIYNYNKSGSVDLIGYSNVKTNNGSVRVRQGEGLSYTYDTASSVNNTVTGTSAVSGLGKLFTAIGTNNSANSSSIGIFNGGRIHQVAKNTDGAASQVGSSKANIRDKLMKMLKKADSDEKWLEHTNISGSKKNLACHNSTYYSTYSNGWRAGALQTTQATSNTTAVTNVTAGADYRIRGINTRDRRPVNFRGNQSVTASYKLTNVGNQVSVMDNVTVNNKTNPEFAKRMAELSTNSLEKHELKVPAHRRP